MEQVFSSSLPEYSFVFAEDFLAAHKGRGIIRPLSCGLRYYVIKDCLCTGFLGQVIMPRPHGGGRPVILEESYNYDHLPDQRLLPLLTMGNARSDAHEELEEAAPMYAAWAVNNFWHWLNNSLLKIILLESAGYSGCYIVNTYPKYVRESLAMIGIAKDRIKESGKHYFVKNLCAVDRISDEKLVAEPGLLMQLRKRLLASVAVPEGTKRCYIRRNGARTLTVESEAAVAALLEAHGFVVFEPEKHSFAEQVAFAGNVDVAVTPHGANSGLSLFFRKKAAFIELFGKKYVTYCNLGAVNLLRLQYIPLVQATGAETFVVDRTTEKHDYDTNIDLLRITLERICGSRP